MKTTADLDALIPVLTDMMLAEPQIGDSCRYVDEDGITCQDVDPKTNYVCYEENGWCIEVYYECCGKWSYDPGDYWTPESHDLVSAWGHVTAIYASHTDEDTDEETEFSEEEIEGLRNALDEALKSM